MIAKPQAWLRINACGFAIFLFSAYHPSPFSYHLVLSPSRTADHSIP
jgi:hypothetical protein